MINRQIYQTWHYVGSCKMILRSLKAVFEYLERLIAKELAIHSTSIVFHAGNSSELQQTYRTYNAIIQNIFQVIILERAQVCQGVCPLGLKYDSQAINHYFKTNFPKGKLFKNILTNNMMKICGFYPNPVENWLTLLPIITWIRIIYMYLYMY